MITSGCNTTAAEKVRLNKMSHQAPPTNYLMDVDDHKKDDNNNISQTHSDDDDAIMDIDNEQFKREKTQWLQKFKESYIINIIPTSVSDWEIKKYKLRSVEKCAFEIEESQSKRKNQECQEQSM